MRKLLFSIVFGLLILFSAFTKPERRIKSILVYRVEEGKSRFIGVNEINIRLNVTAKKNELTNEKCLIRLQKYMEDLVEAKTVKSISSIYVLCEIHYFDAPTQTMSFEEGSAGLIKIGNKIYFQSTKLKSTVLFCN